MEYFPEKVARVSQCLYTSHEVSSFLSSGFGYVILFFFMGVTVGRGNMHHHRTGVDTFELSLHSASACTRWSGEREWCRTSQSDRAIPVQTNSKDPERKSAIRSPITFSRECPVHTYTQSCTGISCETFLFPTHCCIAVLLLKNCTMLQEFSLSFKKTKYNLHQ